jgi:hypothetical protein
MPIKPHQIGKKMRSRDECYIDQEDYPEIPFHSKCPKKSGLLMQHIDESSLHISIHFRQFVLNRLTLMVTA